MSAFRFYSIFAACGLRCPHIHLASACAAFFLGCTLFPAPARGHFSVLLVLEPTDRKDGLLVSRQGLETGLGKALGATTRVHSTDDLTDAMRATRSAAHDVVVAPPQVVASAINHGYELLGSTDAEEEYVLVGQAGLAAAAGLRGQGRLYLPQQDSVYTYLARGMLTAEGLSFRDLRQVDYARYPQAGLVAIRMKLADATVVRQADWDAWSKANPGVAKVLARSGAVPGGLSVAVKATLAADVRSKAARWFESAAVSAGLKPVSLKPELSRSEAAAYRRVAEWGTFTPTALPGATVVDAAAVGRLRTQGAVLVDTRTEAEYAREHIEGARWIPYLEKSLKDVVYDTRADDFSGLAALDKTKPTVFLCNGAECWKSYKASRAALAAGFRQVFWFRGGMPAWQTAR